MTRVRTDDICCNYQCIYMYNNILFKVTCSSELLLHIEMLEFKISRLYKIAIRIAVTERHTSMLNNVIYELSLRPVSYEVMNTYNLTKRKAWLDVI